MDLTVSRLPEFLHLFVFQDFRYGFWIFLCYTCWKHASWKLQIKIQHVLPLTLYVIQETRNKLAEVKGKPCQSTCCYPPDNCPIEDCQSVTVSQVWIFIKSSALISRFLLIKGTITFYPVMSPTWGSFNFRKLPRVFALPLFSAHQSNCLVLIWYLRIKVKRLLSSLTSVILHAIF